MKWGNKNVKKLDFWDVQLIKLSAITFAFWIITLIPVAGEWVVSKNPWIWFALFVVLAVRPFIKILK